MVDAYSGLNSSLNVLPGWPRVLGRNPRSTARPCPWGTSRPAGAPARCSSAPMAQPTRGRLFGGGGQDAHHVGVPPEEGAGSLLHAPGHGIGGVHLDAHERAGDVEIPRVHAGDPVPHRQPQGRRHELHGLVRSQDPAAVPDPRVDGGCAGRTDAAGVLLG
jgi:hypothetical protein